MVGAIKDGRIYGRGSCDMKSGVASHIMAIENMIAAGLKTEGRRLCSTSSSTRRSAAMARSIR